MSQRLIGHLSKGYRQRAGLAQALCGDPEVLVLDEPTVGLDPKQITEIRSLIRTLGKGRTILFSSHILHEVQQLCDHVVILDRGTVKLDTALANLGGQDGMVLKVTLAAAQGRILPALKQMDGVRKVVLQPTVRAEETTALITFEHQNEPERRVFALANTLGAPILHLSRTEDTLEQVFLNVISQ